LQITTPGYGEMELRGAPRAHDITEAHAETGLNAVLDADINYIDTSIERVERGQRRSAWPAIAITVSPPASGLTISAVEFKGCTQPRS